eukprot:766891-Hanusia_phi.AAC.2
MELGIVSSYVQTSHAHFEPLVIVKEVQSDDDPSSPDEANELAAPSSQPPPLPTAQGEQGESVIEGSWEAEEEEGIGYQRSFVSFQSVERSSTRPDVYERELVGELAGEQDLAEERYACPAAAPARAHPLAGARELLACPG